MECNVCFVILHFGKNPQLTIDSISSIKQIEGGSSADVVVVCNGSDCDISDLLKKSFPQHVSTVVLEQNMGFSVGNNIGYQFAKTHGNYDFILFINNDIVIRQTDFIPALYRVYQQTPFYLCGPDIYTPSVDYHSSPLRNCVPDIHETEQIISEKERYISYFKKLFSFVAFKSFLMEAKHFHGIPSGAMRFWRKIRNNNKPYRNTAENVVLQGSCLIISKKFIEQNKKVFEPEVFLYFEEYYLAEKCAQRQWNTLYSNQLQVYHMHRGSSGLSGMTYRAYCQKKISITEVYLLAAKQYREHLISVN